MNNMYDNVSSYCCVACNIYFNNFDEQKQHCFLNHSGSYDHESLKSALYSQYRSPYVTNKKTIPVQCDVCNITCSSQTTYDFHIKGKKHTKALSRKDLFENGKTASNAKVEGNDCMDPVEYSDQQGQILSKSNLTCEICDVNCLRPEQLERHLEGSRHRKKLKLNRYIELRNNKDPSVFCDICESFMNEESMNMHRASGKHKRKSSAEVKDEPAEKKARSADIPTTVEHCGYCHMSLKNASDAIAHYQTQKHALNMTNRSRNFELWCDVCQISFTNQSFLDLHLTGFKHFVRVNRGNSAPEGAFGERLMKMRAKLQSLKQSRKEKKSSNDEKCSIVPSEQPQNEPLTTASEDAEGTSNGCD